ncbi:MAG: hypothetical protein JWP81_547 [Ferruginibacter sp.]|nr:hypothetical protein [Ferruginibacter sp.]
MGKIPVMNNRIISSIKTGNLRKGEFLQFLDDILAVVASKGPARLEVQKQYDELKTICNSIGLLTRKPKRSAITARLKELDLRRDDALIGFRGMVHGYTLHSDPDISKAATLLKDELAIFGKTIYRDNYQSETAKLRKMLSNWGTKPLLVAAITQLNLQAWASELKAANELFNSQYVERASQKGAASNITVKQIRLQSR